MEGQTSIKSLAEQNLRGIAAALDEFKDDEEYWRLLVDQLPRGTFRSWEVERFAAATLQDRSPSLLLLQEVQQRQLVSTIEELVIALDRIGCHRALNVLALKCKAMCTNVQCVRLYSLWRIFISYIHTPLCVGWALTSPKCSAPSYIGNLHRKQTRVGVRYFQLLRLLLCMGLGAC